MSPFEALNAAFSTAKAIVDSDPTLSLEEHKYLRNEVDRRMKILSSSIS